ncbi:PH domain-containing protein [Corynebacterium pacaense]|uniref:PH domain-containing protein n=1 Tax=Corynebacterium pacaense TaxID=1816684 RepID=UPI0009B964C1|nr:PH domain-containing protein [Corynebacterium pacaense]
MSSDPQDTAAEAAQQAVRFHPERTHILSAVVLGLISLLVIGAAPLYLFWLLVFPALFIYWVLKSETVVDSSGIRVRYAFKGGKEVPWEDFSGIGFKGAGAFARTTSGTEIPLPGVSFNSLPELQRASNGRIPDVLTQGRQAMDGKVVVVTEDGDSILLTREEYLERQKALDRDVQIDFDGQDGNTGTAPGVEYPTDTRE